jgi:predicted metal-dependent phosphoesterase TrpH
MNLYKYDTHVHTSETSPCGGIEGKKLVQLYKNAGYRGLVITDHYFNQYFDSLNDGSWEEKIESYLKGYKAALDEGRKLGLNIILGMEIRFEENDNDYLVYGIDEAFLIENKELYKLGLEKFKKLAESNDLLIYQAHPFRSWIVPVDTKYLDGVEVFNGNPRQESANPLALSYANSNKLKMISGSDFHQIEDLALGGIVIPEAPENSLEFVKLLNSNKIIELLC